MSKGSKSKNKPDPKRLAHYTSILLDSEAWFRVARGLFKVMETLQPNVEEWCKLMRESHYEKFDEVGLGAFPIYMLVGGLTIENLCKGYLIAKLSEEEKASIRETGKLPDRLKTHDLYSLAKAIGFPMASSLQKPFLEQVTKIVVWRSRYPAPTSAELMTPSYESTGDPRRVRLFALSLSSYVAHRLDK